MRTETRSSLARRRARTRIRTPFVRRRRVRRTSRTRAAPGWPARSPPVASRPPPRRSARGCRGPPHATEESLRGSSEPRPPPRRELVGTSSPTASGPQAASPRHDGAGISVTATREVEGHRGCRRTRRRQIENAVALGESVRESQPFDQVIFEARTSQQSIRCRNRRVPMSARAMTRAGAIGVHLGQSG